MSEEHKKSLCVCFESSQKCSLCRRAELNSVQFLPIFCHTNGNGNEYLQHVSASHTHTHALICWCVIFLYFSGRSAYPCSRDSLCLHPRGIYITYIYSACLCVELMETDMRADMDTELCCTGPCGLTQQQG